MKKQQGFTLIELIVVIVILGILAATALPRFTNLQGDARLASVQGAQGAINSAASLAHASWLVAGSSAATTVTMEGSIVDMVNGYPAATAAGISRAAGLEGSAAYTIVAGNPISYSPTGATAATCKVDYTQAAAANTSPTIALTATAAGCL